VQLLRQELFNRFTRSYDPPHWIIEDLLWGGSDSEKAALASAIAAVPSAIIAELDDDARAQSEILFRTKDQDLRARLYLVSRDAARAIDQARLAAITSDHTTGAPPPYDHPALDGIAVDDEGLVPLQAFELNGDALCVNGHSFFMVPPVPGSNASYWLLQHACRRGLADSVRVRLDPLLHGPSNELSGRSYRMDVYGRPLDWDRIRQLRTPDHGRWIPGKMSRRFLSTEYAWIPHDDEVDFLCEELPVPDKVTDRGSRYLHAVYGKRNHQMTHLDGAIRIYSREELDVRATTHVRNSGKAGTRVKVFRTDQPIAPDLLGDLAQAFFTWNYDVARYFGAPVPPNF
jgi:hypothetical protein